MEILISAFLVFFGILNFVIGIGGIIQYAQLSEKYFYGFWPRMVSYLIISANFFIAVWLLGANIPKLFGEW